MKSYIKIYGPPLLKAIKALETIAIDTPNVCIADVLLEMEKPNTMEDIKQFFNPLKAISDERCNRIISKARGTVLGEYDFFFEWFEKPRREELNELIMKIDAALAPLGCKYTITTKS